MSHHGGYVTANNSWANFLRSYSASKNADIEAGREPQIKNIRELSAAYHAERGTQPKPKKHYAKSECVGRPRENCNLPCAWKNAYTRKDGPTVKPHCMKPSPFFTPSATGPKRPKYPPTVCKSRPQDVCDKPCVWNKGATVTYKKGRMEGRTVTRRPYCAFRGVREDKPTDLETYERLRGQRALPHHNE